MLYPTDNLGYRLHDNEEAVEKLYAIKHRDKSKSMLILLDNPENTTIFKMYLI